VSPAVPVRCDSDQSESDSEWRFLCAVDADPRDAPLLRWAAQFSAEQKVELRVVHALQSAEPFPPGQEPASMRGFLLDMAEQRISDLQSAAGTNMDILLGFGRVEDVVRDTALAHQADLILIGRGVLQQALGRIRSAAYSIIREAPCPVISV